MKGKMLIILGFLATIILPIFSNNVVFADTLPAPAPSSRVVITEVKLGGDSYSLGITQPKDAQEFVTLYNQSDTEVDLTGWSLEYAKTTFDKTYCTTNNWVAHSVSGSASQTLLSGSIKPGQVSTPVVRPLTDNAGGSLHLVDLSNSNSPKVQDLIGWGSTAACYSTSPTTTPSNGKSIKRYLDCKNLPVDTGNNLQDFAVNQPPSPGTLNNPYLNNCDTESAQPETSEQSQTSCSGAVISEILANPAGSDSANEFIELYNPTASVISLQGCSLQTTGSSKVFSLDNNSLQPGEYHAFYSGDSSLSLPNAAGGTVWLLSPNEEIQSITYQADLADDMSWALINGSWQATYQATPSTANILVVTKPCPEGEERNVDTGYCHSISALTTSNLTVCKEGQEKNPETNRCRASATASSNVTSCKEGQVRNPDTNRCKAETSTSTSLTVCKLGQERNPDTNRCKATATTASAALKACPTGQERSSTTNRCKKSGSTGAIGKLTNVKDVTTGSLANNPHWWAAGFAAAGATSYGVYEWRQEVLRLIGKIKTKLPGISTN
jgi:hypothetical protein